MYLFKCDMCGRELEHHGERYIARVERVPYETQGAARSWDLCRECSESLREHLDGRMNEAGD